MEDIAKMTEQELIEKLVESKRVTRGTLAWVVSKSMPDDRDRDDNSINALIAWAAKIAESPVHMHHLLDAAAWTVTNALGLAPYVADKRANFPPPSAETRRALIVRMIELRDAEVDFMPAGSEDEDERDKAEALCSWARQRFNLQNPGEACFLFAQTIALLCLTSDDPAGAMKASAQVIIEFRDSLAETESIVKP